MRLRLARYDGEDAAVSDNFGSSMEDIRDTFFHQFNGGSFADFLSDSDIFM